MSRARRLATDLTPPAPLSLHDRRSVPEGRRQGEGGAAAAVTVGARIDRRKLELARRFRKEPTRAEAEAWAVLRNRGVLGLKVRRQQIVAGFIVDFYCASHRLVLELDGAVHDAPERAARDADRTAAFRRLNIRTIRLRNDELSRERLVQVLSAALRLPPLPADDLRVRNGGRAGRGGPGG